MGIPPAQYPNQLITLYVWTINFQIYGKGEQTRSFQYVTDLVDGLISLMNSNYSLPVNLGNPEEHSINEFAEIIKELSSKSAMA